MDRYGLIGNKLAHSFSKEFFTRFFQKEKIDATYTNIELENLVDIVEIAQKFKGLNVTIPYKEQILPYLDEVDPVAQEIGAVNTIQIRNGKLKGYNTDVFGFHQSIKPFLTNKHERAIIFGTGGASKAVNYVLEKIGVDVLFISRTPMGINQFQLQDVNEHMLRACKLLVNCTPIGMYPKMEEVLDIPFQYLTDEHLVVDLIYNPTKTVFLQKVEENGATILNGESMLHEQAMKSWEIWSETCQS